MSSGPISPGKPPRRDRQQAVACFEAEALVDGLEAIEVDDNHVELAVGLHMSPPHGNFQPIDEQGAVGQAGHPVADCIGQQTLFGPLHAGDVGQSPDAARSAAVRTHHRPGAQQIPAIRSVVPAQSELLRERASSAPLRRFHRRHVGRPVGGMDELDPRLQAPARHGSRSSSPKARSSSGPT